MIEKAKKTENTNINWLFVVSAWVVIVVLYFVVNGIMHSQPRVTAYCQFNTSIYDDAPRDQCAIMKIVSRDIEQVNIHQFERFGRCSESLEALPICEGFETYHFSKYTLKDMCEEEGCKVDGVICNAFFVTYRSDIDATNQKEFEQAYFTEANVESEEKLMQMLNDCDAGGWLPWS